MNANVPMLDEIAGKNTKEVIDVLNETIRQQQAEIELLKRNMNTATNELLQQQAEIEVLKADLLKYDRLAWDDLDKEKTELTMTFEEMYPIAEKHLGHAIGLYNWKIFGDAILRKASEK